MTSRPTSGRQNVSERDMSVRSARGRGRQGRWPMRTSSTTSRLWNTPSALRGLFQPAGNGLLRQLAIPRNRAAGNCFDRSRLSVLPCYCERCRVAQETVWVCDESRKRRTSTAGMSGAAHADGRQRRDPFTYAIDARGQGMRQLAVARSLSRAIDLRI